MIAFYNGVSGLVAYQEAMNVTSHNIANVNTTGFKASRSSFTDLLYTQMNTKVEGENLVGHGVKHQDTDLIFRQSGLAQSDSPLDFAITGEGLFALEHEGKTSYTRNGSFRISAKGQSLYLVADDGSFVLDKSGKSILIPLKKGTNVPDLEGLAEKVGVYTFSNPYGLAPAEGSRFTETDTSGEAKALKETGNGILQQYMLEYSGVTLANEMVKMIEAQRGFQLNSRVVQTADELEGSVNNLRK